MAIFYTKYSLDSSVIRIYFGKDVHWRDNGGWRTGGKFYRTAGFDDQGVHHIYLNQTRYEYFPGGPGGEEGEGVLHHYITRHLTSPEDEAKVKQQKYDHPFPPVTPAEQPIQTSGFNTGTGFSHYTLDCAVPDEELKMASDYTIWDIVKIYIQMAIQSDSDSGED